MSWIVTLVWITEVIGVTVARDNYEALFSKGVAAYLEEDWIDCLNNFNKAIQEFKNTQNNILQCRNSCTYEANDGASISNLAFKDELAFFEPKIRKTLCLVKCKNLIYIEIDPVWDLEVTSKFESLQPYEYLHICYYHNGDYQKAASAAFTFLAIHPNSKVMKDNLDYYLTLPNVDSSQLSNYELKPFTKLYIEGNDAYTSKNYDKVINYFEESLASYLFEEDNCRTLCERDYSQEWFAEFTITLTNHFTSILRCKQLCSKKLSMINGELYEDLVPSYYNYLQYAYYKLGKLDKACEAVATYLLFFPDDPTMNYNKNFYLTEGAKTNDFIPDTEIVSYYERNIQEKAILKFIDENFSTKEEKEANEEICPIRDSPKDTSLAQVNDANQTPEQAEKKEMLKRAIQQMRNTAKITLVKGEKDLNGTYRFLSKGFLTTKECRRVLEVANIFALDGDGYRAKASPHTDKETFTGLSIGRLALLVYHRYLRIEVLGTFYEATENARDYLERYFNLDKELYFSYSHLVCREALAEFTGERFDMSHEIHGDNCQLLDDGSCLKEPPAFTWRDYSMVLYLNNDFEGGDFIFAANGDISSEQSRVTPLCGLGLGYSSGGENLHGVTAVTKGKRCAIAMWFTHDKHSQEMERLLAEIVLKRMKMSGNYEANDLTITLLTKYSGFDIDMASKQWKQYQSSNN